jgi:hypothetical protein
VEKDIESWEQLLNTNAPSVEQPAPKCLPAWVGIIVIAREGKGEQYEMTRDRAERRGETGTNERKQYEMTEIGRRETGRERKQY